MGCVCTVISLDVVTWLPDSNDKQLVTSHETCVMEPWTVGGAPFGICNLAYLTTGSAPANSVSAIND